MSGQARGLSRLSDIVKQFSRFETGTQTVVEIKGKTVLLKEILLKFSLTTINNKKDSY